MGFLSVLSARVALSFVVCVTLEGAGFLRGRAPVSVFLFFWCWLQQTIHSLNSQKQLLQHKLEEQQNAAAAAASKARLAEAKYSEQLSLLTEHYCLVRSFIPAVFCAGAGEEKRKSYLWALSPRPGVSRRFLAHFRVYRYVV